MKNIFSLLILLEGLIMPHIPKSSSKCQCRVVDAPHRRCRGSKWTKINGVALCILHARYHYLKQILIIQNAYKNYKMRIIIFPTCLGEPC